MYKLDRTAFSMGSHEEAEQKNQDYWQKQSMKDRLNAAVYLNSIAYHFDIEQQPKLDKMAFSMRKHGE